LPKKTVGFIIPSGSSSKVKGVMRGKGEKGVHREVGVEEV
jgi:hypothetical protein